MSKFVPIKKVIPWPEDLFSFGKNDDGSTALDNLGVENFEIDGQTISVDLLCIEEIILGIPGIDGLEIIIGSDDDFTRFSTRLSFGKTFEITISLDIGFRFASGLFQPVQYNAATDSYDLVYQSPGGDVAPYQIDLLDITFNFNDSGEFSIGFSPGAPAVGLSPVLIGNTGIVIEASGISFVFSQEDADAIPAIDPASRGVFIQEAAIRLPDQFAGVLPQDIYFEDAFIGSGGFSGSVELDLAASVTAYDMATAKTIFGFGFTFQSIQVELRQNALIRFSIAGFLKVPFFDDVLDVQLGVTNDGDVTVSVGSTNGLLVLEKQGVISIQVSSLEFIFEDGEFLFKLSGEVTPLISVIDWPTFELKSLSISSDGKVKVDGGWLELPEQKTLDFYGFKVEISSLGFGSDHIDGTDYNWIGFSGGIQLVQSLPLRGGVEGLKVMWDNNGTPKLKIGGVYLEFEIPGVLRFDGTVNFIDEANTKEFRGGVDIFLTPLNFGLNAQFITGQTNDFNYFYIFIDLELPVGVPLGPPIVGVYGLSGLYGHNMSLDYDNLIDYPNQSDRPDMTNIANWQYQKDAKAFGAGLTVGTLPDIKFLAKAKAVFAILIPGPVLLIEGHAGIVSLGDNYIFRVLAVIDPGSGTFLMNISATYKYPNDSGDLLNAQGAVEAFFSTADPDDWHIYLGEESPDSKRIRAQILSFFTAKTYLMIDKNGLKMGVWIGYSLNEKYGILKVVLNAWIDGKLQLSTMPFQAAGSLTLYGNAELSAGPVSLGISVEANVTAEAPKPLSIVGSLKVLLKTPVGKPKATIRLKWEKPGVPPYALPLSPTLGIEHRKVIKNWDVTKREIYGLDSDNLWNGSVNSNAAVGNVPLVPPDVRLVLNFDKPVEDAGLIGSNPAPKPADEKVGEYRFKYALERVELQYRDTWNEHSDDGNWDDYEDFAENQVENGWGTYTLTGAWQVTPGTDDIANTKLILNATTPFEISRALENNESWLALLDVYNNDYPCITIPEEKQTCVDMENRQYGIVHNFFVEEDFIFISDFPMSIHPYHAGWLGTEKALNNPAMSTTVIECLKIWSQEETGEVKIITINKVILLAGVGGKSYIKLTSEYSEKGKTEHYVDSSGATLPASIKFPAEVFPDFPCKVYITCIIKNSRDILFYAYDDEKNIVVKVPPKGKPGEEVTYELDSSSGPIRTIVIMTDNIRILKICYEKKQKSDESNILVVMPDDMMKVNVHFAKDSVGTFFLYDKDEQEIKKIGFRILKNLPDNQVKPVELSVENQSFRSFLVKGDFQLIRVCGVTVEDGETFKNNSAISEHFETQLEENWGRHTAQILHPNKFYRLKIETSASRKKQNGDWVKETFEEYMYFKTGNPPGPPSVLQASEADHNRYDLEAPLNDLSPYIDYTIPAGAAANEPQYPVYRSYDVGVVCNDSYIDQMYQMANQPINIRFLDNNNQPVMDADGSELKLLNQWGDNPELAETREETQYKNILDESDCLVIQVEVTSENKQELIASSRDLLLKPQIQYRAQVMAGELDSIYEFAFISSRYANFLHHAHSFIDAAWNHFSLLEDPTYTIDSAALEHVLDNGEDEHVKFEQLMDVFDLNPRTLPERVEVALLNDGNQSYGLLLESPEPIDWDRIEINLFLASKPETIEEFDGNVKIVGGSVQRTKGPEWNPDDFNSQYVDLLVLETTDLSKYTIESLPVNENGHEYDHFYTFESGATYNAGTRLRIFAGPDPGQTPDDTEHVNLYADRGEFSFKKAGQFIRLKNADDEILHTRPLYSERVFLPLATNLVRNQDGTRFFTFVPGAGQGHSDLQNGIFKFQFNFKRDIGAQAPVLKRFGFSEPEETSIVFSLAPLLPAGL